MNEYVIREPSGIYKPRRINDDAVSAIRKTAEYYDEVAKDPEYAEQATADARDIRAFADKCEAGNATFEDLWNLDTTVREDILEDLPNA